MRMSRLFNPKSKRMVLVTMDHGICGKSNEGNQ